MSCSIYFLLQRRWRVSKDFRGVLRVKEPIRILENLAKIIENMGFPGVGRSLGGVGCRCLGGVGFKQFQKEYIDLLGHWRWMD